MLRMELHCHTMASSDGMITVDGMLKAARLQQVNVIAITDHDTTEGAFEFQRWFRNRGHSLQILVGEERTLDSGCHIIGLCLREQVQSQDLQGFVGEVRSQGGLIYVPHPFRRKDGLVANLPQADELLAAADAWEGHNAKGSAADNVRARNWISDNKLRLLGGSDAHYEADLGRCVVETEFNGEAEMALRAMIAGKQGYRVLARPQAAHEGERRYAPFYYRLRSHLRLPRALLPAAKQVYRLYWNMRFGRQKHALQEIHHQPIHVE
jgi:predicted metal-dependent phosphoesterase TrpH